MAELHPEIPRTLSAGQYREREMLELLAKALPAACTIYHGLQISHMHESSQRYGELDAVVVFPAGHVAVLEVKAGEVELSERGAFKRYGSVEKNLAHQAHAQWQGLIGRLREVHLGAVRIAHFLLLPDFRVVQGTIGYPRERIIDASQLDHIGALLSEACRHAPIGDEAVARLHDFFADRFSVVPDAACRQGQRQAATRRLAEGLATWVPRVQSRSGVYVVEATAGSGKTQLALALLHDADRRRERAHYVCFNRPLADHIARLAPVRAEVSTADELGIAALRATGAKPDFKNDGAVFRRGFQALCAMNAEVVPTLDLLIIDESQDFDGEWLEALVPRLKPEGRLYVLGDSSQAIYRKEAFDLSDATRIVCPDNFRSPRRIVETLNLLRLTPEPVVARGPDLGEVPALHVYEPSDVGGLGASEAVVAGLLRDGHSLGDIALISFRGRQHSALLNCERLGPWILRRFTGEFDAADNPLWTDGELLVESVYRFKGQSAPIVIVCEIDFEVLDDQRARMLFVAMTRAQMQLHLVMSSAAEKALAARLEPVTDLVVAG
ncbi:ATP-binding domain-containing protein [Variovorax sp. dw_954]|uniref:ATP-binding domain-containing protein n=1 Tax=Variovorax sp. dw_954 TaxID=2720078 RepID=UPI001BD3727D|nr:ATP-binding domain-containing protein [Variovorax sp. dw_954]